MASWPADPVIHAALVEVRWACASRSPLFGWACAALGLFAAMLLGFGLGTRDPTWFATGFGVGVAGLAIASIIRPGLGAAALLVILFTRVSDLPWLDGLPVSLTQLVVVLFMGAALVNRLVFRPRRFEWDATVTWMLVYGAAIGLSAATAVDGRTTLAALVAYLRDVLIVLVLIHLVSSAADLRHCLWALSLGGAVLAGAAVVQAVTGFDSGGLSSLGVQFGPTAQTIRLEGPIGLDSNYFGQLLVLVVPLALYLSWTESRPRWRAAALGILALVTVVLMWTFSRGGFLSLLVVLAAAAVLRRSSGRRLAVIAALLVVIGLGAPHLYWGRMGLTAGNAVSLVEGATPAAAPAREDDSIFDRSSLVRVGLLIFLEHPLTGVGKGNYLAVFPRYFERVDAGLPARGLGPHNAFVQIAAESGLAGLVTFIAVIVFAGLSVRTARRELRGRGLERESLLIEAIGLAIVGYLLTAMFLNDNTYQRYLWLLVGLVVAGRRLALRGEPAP
jgi:putative inorganic carbon (hco3(-)) transporter